MSLTIIAGLPGSGAQERARTRACAAAEAGRSALLVVPSSTYAARVRAELCDTRPAGVRVVSFGRLVESEWSLQGDGRRIVGGLCRDVLLANALVKAGVSDHPGRGAVALLGTLAAKACAIGVEPAARVGGLSGKLLAALRSYLAALFATGLVDEAEATRSLGGCAPPAAVVVSEGLVSLTSDREELLRAWSGAGSEVVLHLPWARGCAATQPLDVLVGRLEAAGAHVECVASVPNGRPAELVRVATDLFSGSAPVPGDGRVVLGVASGEEAEARLIAERVSELVSATADGGGVAVAFADPARHVGWLRRSFEDAGVEAVWDVRTPVPETPMGRAMLHLWAFSSAGMGREDLASLLRSPFSGVDRDRVDRADARWRGRRLSGAQLIGEADRARPLVMLCSGLAGRQVDRGSASGWKQLADTLLANAYGCDAPKPGMDGALDAAVHRAFCGAVAAAADGQGIAASELWAAFKASTVSPAVQGERGAVIVTSLDGLRGRSFGAVVIGGLTAGETPRQGSDDRLEGDAVRGALRGLGIEVDLEEHARSERLAFYLAATSATSSLTLVRRESDDEGRPLRASVFWDEFLDLYRLPGEGEEEAALLPTRVRAAEGEACRAAGARTRRGVLADPAVLASLADIDVVSPGEVELYAACPYRWFVQRRLRPAGPDVEIDAIVAGLAEHKALAAFYRDWTDAGPRARVTSERLEEALDCARAAVSRTLAGVGAPSSLDEAWLLGSVEPAVLGLVRRDATFLPDYTPTEFEWSFGISQGEEPVDLGGVAIKGRADRIDVGPQGLVVIDYKRSKASSRAEIGREGLVQLQLYALAASRRLELPVAGGLYRSLSAPSDRGFILDSVAGAFVGSDVTDVQGVDLLLEQAAGTARAAFDGMRSGIIAPDPDAKRCKYCPALAFCPEGIRS